MMGRYPLGLSSDRRRATIAPMGSAGTAPLGIALVHDRLEHRACDLATSVATGAFHTAAVQSRLSRFLYRSHGQPQEGHVLPARGLFSAESDHGEGRGEHASPRREADRAGFLGLARVEARDSIVLAVRYFWL